MLTRMLENKRVYRCMRTYVCLYVCVKDNGNRPPDCAHPIQPHVTDGVQPPVAAYRHSAELLCVSQLERNKWL